MSELRYFLLVVFCIDAVLLLGQHAANEINPSGTQFITYEGSITSRYDQGNYTINPDVSSQLPTSESSISPTTGNLFTDIFSTAKTWMLSLPGVGFIISAANALPTWLASFGLDIFFAYAISAIWHGYAIWLIVEFLFGR